MSTRATYLFKGGEYRPAVCVYIHHDGYPAGAAYYLLNAFKAGGMSAEGMIRGNDRAEITESHDAHGDTEYRYTIDGNNVKVEERHTLIEFGSYPQGWRTAFAGDWVDFINQHISKDWAPDFKPLRRVKIEYTSEVHSPETLKAKLDADLTLCGLWATNGNGKGANWDNLCKRITTMRGLLAQFGPAEWNEAA